MQIRTPNLKLHKRIFVFLLQRTEVFLSRYHFVLLVLFGGGGGGKPALLLAALPKSLLLSIHQ